MKDQRIGDTEVGMSVSVLFMSMSLDGYIADTNDFLGGEDDHRLHNWFAPGGEFGELTGPAKELFDEMNACGAVIAGRRTAELMDHWGGDHNGLPIFVPSHRPPGPPARWSYPLVRYVTDGIASTMEQAKAAAGDKNVHMVGGYTARKALEAGVLDEMQIHLIPVLLGGGIRLLEDFDPEGIELRRATSIETPGATHLRFEVVK